MPALIGQVVEIEPFDWQGRPDLAPRVGDVLLSSGGSLYEILEMRPNKNRALRYSMRCLKVSETDVLDRSEARIYTFAWTPRNRRRA